MARLTRRYHVPSALRSSPTRISDQSARELVDRGALLIDVRRKDDPAAVIAGSVRISPDLIPGHVDGFRRDVPIVLGCT